MALLTLPKSPTRRGRHAARTPFWRQIGIGRARHDLTAAPLVSAPAQEPAAEQAPVPAPVVSAEQARALVERLFPPGPSGLYPLDWRCGAGWASAQVDPGLIVDAARNIVLAYAAEMAAAFVQEQVDDRLHMRVSRAVDGVQVTVWADITPDPSPQLALPAPATERVEERLPCERLAHAALDETQAFAAITDDMDDPRATPDGDLPVEPTDPDHVADPDPAPAVAVDEPAEDQPADEPEDEHTDEHDDADTASTDDTSSTPLPQGDEDEQEEVAVHG